MDHLNVILLVWANKSTIYQYAETKVFNRRINFVNVFDGMLMNSQEGGV